tara:strand:+ start:118 stop:291 length:174 start_codon:yes stop_codon:yes gene_type:complete
LKEIKVKFSPLFKEQLEDDVKGSKIHKSLLTAIEREKDNLFVNPHKDYNKKFGYKKK